jgi:hypothetical protein
MKTAQGAISVDVSKFNSAIDSAKGKLASFGSSLNAVGSVARTTWKVFDLVTGVSERISIITKGAKDLQSIFNALPTAIKRVSDGFQNLKTFASQAGEVLSKVPTTFKVIGASAVVAGVSIFGVVKALQAVSGATKSALSGISSVASGLANMAKSATASVGGAVSSAFRGFLGILKPVGVAVGGLGLAFGALDRFFKIGIMSAIEMGDEMKNLAGRTGASIPFLVDLQKLLKNSGVSSMSGAVALQNMQRALTGVNADGEPTNDMLARLKLNVDDLMKMTPEQQFMIIGKAISNLSTSAEQTAAAFSIFGKAGASLKGVFKEAGFAELGTKQSQLGQSLAKNADNFSKISAKLRDSGSFFRGFFVEMAGAVAPSILELFKLFEGGDMLSGFGAKLGEQIRFGVEVLTGAFKSGMIFDLLKASFETAGIVLEDLLQRSFTFASNLLKRLLEADVSTAVLSGIGSAIVGSLSIIAGTLVKAFATPIAYLQAGIQTAFESSLELLATKLPAVASLMGVGGFKGSGMDANFAERKAGISAFADETITAGFENIADGVRTAVKGATDSFNILKNSLEEFPAQGEKAKNATSGLVGQLNALAVAGKPTEKTVSEIAGAEVLGAKVKSMSGGKASEGVSSLQRIGGGGGAFKAADPIVKETQKQTAVMEKVATLIEPITKKVTENALVPSMNQGGMVKAFLG